MNIEEFAHLKKLNDDKFSLGYSLPGGETFYIEPAFYTQLINFKELYNEVGYKRIIKKMEELAKERKRIIFVYDFENPFLKKDGYIYLEFTDVTDSLGIIIDDKSRGSDYGD